MNKLIVVFSALLFSCLHSAREHAANSRINPEGKGSGVIYIHEPASLMTAVPDNHRDIGYDSIQMLFYDGKVESNFCYPNGLRFKKDTVYTHDTIYRLWGYKLQVAPDIFIATRAGKGITQVRDGGFYMDSLGNLTTDSVTIDSIKFVMTKVPYE